jgi:hypothetical protein
MSEANKLFEKEINRIWEEAREQARKDKQIELENKCNMPNGVLNPKRKEDVIL